MGSFEWSCPATKKAHGVQLQDPKLVQASSNAEQHLTSIATTTAVRVVSPIFPLPLDDHRDNDFTRQFIRPPGELESRSPKPSIAMTAVAESLICLDSEGGKALNEKWSATTEN